MSDHSTKRVLADALKALMQTTSLDHITINRLADKAHINRNTFYYHFSDISALLQWTYEQDIISQVDPLTNIDHWQEAYKRIMAYITDNQNFCLQTFHSLSRSILDDFLFQVAQNMVDQVVLSIDASISKRLRDDIDNFLGWAIAAQFIQWLVSDIKESPESMIQRAEIMLSGTLEHVITNGQARPFTG